MTMLLSTTALEVTYGRSVKAVRGVDLELRSGTTTALLGANGAGKTSLLRAVTGMLAYEGGRVSGGAVEVMGCAVHDAPPEVVARLGVAHVPQGRRVFGRMTVEENLVVGGHRRRRAGIRRDVVELLDQLEPLARRRHQRAALLSGGEQQLLAVGRALMGRPAVLLLDEPSLGLAPIIASEMMATIVGLVAARDLAVLVVEQNAVLALRHAEWALVLDRGRVVRSGPAEELAADPGLGALYLGQVLDPDAPSEDRAGREAMA